MNSYEVTVDGHRVELSASAAESLRAATMNAFTAGSPVGHEVAGILFGRTPRDLIRIFAWREIPRADSAMPALPLTPESLRFARDLLASYLSDIELQELRPIGWFRSRTRGMAALWPEDAAACRQLLPGEPCLALILRPSTQRPVTASFFWVNDADAGDSSRRGVLIQLPGPAAAPSCGTAGVPRRDPHQPTADSGPVLPASAVRPASRSRSRGRWVAPTVAFLAGLGAASWAGYWWIDRPLRLDASVASADSGEVLSVTWNRNAGILSKAEGAELQINNLPRELSREQLRQGEFRIQLPVEPRATRVRLRLRGPYAEGQSATVLHVRPGG